MKKIESVQSVQKICGFWKVYRSKFKLPYLYHRCWIFSGIESVRYYLYISQEWDIEVRSRSTHPQLWIVRTISHPVWFPEGFQDANLISWNLYLWQTWFIISVADHMASKSQHITCTMLAYFRLIYALKCASVGNIRCTLQ